MKLTVFVFDIDFNFMTSEKSLVSTRVSQRIGFQNLNLGLHSREPHYVENLRTIKLKRIQLFK